ncbi:MAG TPA: Hpt domain-containing protein [Longimicrobium sp.]|jgi:HPt (histidine-containing phosphotransfer) domain-containing protein
MTHEAPDASPAGDPAALERLHRWGGDALQRQMVEMFLARVPGQLAAARDAAARGDAEGVRQVAHSLKSSAGQLGAVSVQRLCTEAEHRAAAGEGATLTPLVSALYTELERYREWVLARIG